MSPKQQHCTGESRREAVEDDKGRALSAVLNVSRRVAFPSRGIVTPSQFLPQALTIMIAKWLHFITHDMKYCITEIFEAFVLLLVKLSVFSARMNMTLARRQALSCIF